MMLLTIPRTLFLLLVTTATSAFFVSAQENITNLDPQQQLVACQEAFYELKFDFRFLLQYEEFYNEESVYEIAEIGAYVGPFDILEYVMFAYPGGTYLSNFTIESETTPSRYIPVLNNNETLPYGTCAFYHINTKYFSTEPSNSNEASVLQADMAKIYYDMETDKVSRLNVYLPKAGVDVLFGKVLDSTKTQEFICKTMIENCTEIHALNGSPTLEECIQSLTALPLVDGDGYADGNSQGCRAVHSVFSRQNKDHCPHISFVPTEDKKGIVKCQESKQTPISDLFTEEDLARFQAWVLSPESLIESESGIKVLSMVGDELTSSGGGGGALDDEESDTSDEPTSSVGACRGVHSGGGILLTMLFAAGVYVFQIFTDVF